MELKLLSAALEDIPAFVDIYMRAFQDEIATTCFPRSSPHVRKWWTDMNADAIQNEPSARFIKVVGGEEIIAWAKWNVPVHVGDTVSGGGDDPDDMPSWPEDADEELCNEFFGVLARKRREIIGDRPHFFLEIVGTVPEHQGKGAAGRLIRWGLEQADAMGLEAYLEASPTARPVYEHFGFKTVEEFRPSKVHHVESFMIRSPKNLK